MVALLSAVELKNYRSFDALGANFANLKNANLLLGPNNVGKSNLLRFLVWLRDQLVAAQLTNPSEEDWQRLASFDSTSIAQGDFWNLDESTPITAILKFSGDHPQVQKYGRASIYGPDVGIKIKVFGPNHVTATPLGKFGKTEDVEVLTFNELTHNLHQVRLKTGNLTGPNGAAGVETGCALLLLSTLARSLINVEALRHHRLATKLHTRSTDGGALIARLNQLASNVPDRRRWTDVRNRLEKWMQRLIGEPEQPALESQPDMLWLEFKRGGQRQNCSIDDLGTGITEAFMLLSFLELNAASDSIVCIEEPEAHLHPGAVQELMRILTNDIKVPQLIVTSHSTSLVDHARDGWGIYRLARDATGATRTYPTETHESQSELLDDLGVRASQLFLANATIWVEGPSDIIYITAMLAENARELVPGRDYAFVPYGGASGSHLTFDTETREKLLPLLRVSRNVVVVGDRDRDPRSGLRELLKRLTEEAESVGAGAHLAATGGREIENSVRDEVLLGAVKDHFPGYVVRKKKNESITFPALSMLRETESFDEAIANASTYTSSGLILVPDDAEKVARTISGRKVDIARAVVRKEKPFKDHEWIKALAAKLQP